MNVPLNGRRCPSPCPAVIEYFIQIKSKRQMSSNRQLAADKSLYLKLFFTSYFERKNTLETISQLTNGLTVIDSLVQQFQHQQNIATLRTAAKQELHVIGSGIQIQAEEKSINSLLEDLYNRLSHIFESVRCQNENESLFSDKAQCMNEAVQDDQLYDILNKYKIDCKREKDQRSKVEKDLNKVKQAYELCRLEKDKASQKARGGDKVIEALRRANSSLEETIASLKQQLQQLAHQKQDLIIKLEDCLQLQSSFDHLTKRHQLLQLKYEQSQQREHLLEQKFKNLDAVIKAKIEQGQAKWAQVVEDKLSQKDIVNAPACQAFRQFVHCFNKENKRADK